MKNSKIMKFSIYMILMLAISVSLLACGKKTNKNDLTGTTWTVIKIVDEDGMVYNEDDIKYYYGEMDFTFKEDGILELCANGEQYEAIWTQDNNKFTYSIYDIETTGTIENDKIIMEMFGEKYELMKKK